MESFTIEIKNPKAIKLLYDLVDLDLIILHKPQPSWSQLWEELDTRLPQHDPNITEKEIIDEINLYRAEKPLR